MWSFKRLKYFVVYLCTVLQSALSWQPCFTEMKMRISGIVVPYCLVRLFISFLSQPEYQLLAWEKCHRQNLHKLWQYTKYIQTYFLHVLFTTIMLVPFINKALRSNDVTQCHRKVSRMGHRHTAFCIESHSPLFSILHSRIGTIERIQYNTQDNLEENEVKLNILHASWMVHSSVPTSQDQNMFYYFNFTFNFLYYLCPQIRTSGSSWNLQNFKWLKHVRDNLSQCVCL